MPAVQRGHDLEYMTLKYKNVQNLFFTPFNSGFYMTSICVLIEMTDADRDIQTDEQNPTRIKILWIVF